MSPFLAYVATLPSENINIRKKRLTTIYIYGHKFVASLFWPTLCITQLNAGCTQRISPLDDDLGVLADEVVFAEDEQRPVGHSLHAQSVNDPPPSALTRRRRRGRRDPGRCRSAPGDGRPRAGNVDAAAPAHPGRRDRRRPDNHIHRDTARPKRTLAASLLPSGDSP